MRSQAEKLAVSAVFCVFGMILSYIEALIPFELLVAFPGFKPGLANLASMTVFFVYGAVPALCVSLARIFLSALLFGNVTSLLYSLCGGILAFSVLLAWKYLLRKINGCLGLGVMSAAMHNIGQCLCAALFFGPTVICTYLPVLLFFSLFTGSLTGFLLSLLLNSGAMRYFGGKSNDLSQIER